MTLPRSVGATSASLANNGASAPARGISASGFLLSGEARETLQGLFGQLAQALEALRHFSALIINEPNVLARPSLRKWLQPNARQAESTMHELREMRVITSTALTDLSQSLTVLVLAADMLAQGHLSGSDAMAFYELLQRNIDSSLAALHVLRIQCGIDP